MFSFFTHKFKRDVITLPFFLQLGRKMKLSRKEREKKIEDFKAHKKKLAEISPVFYAQFNGSKSR